jgi:hypothetical protein
MVPGWRGTVCSPFSVSRDLMRDAAIWRDKGVMLHTIYEMKISRIDGEIRLSSGPIC